MPTRKQRRRRDKTFRHEYTLVDYDEEGNEIETTSAALRDQKDKPDKPKASTPAKGGRAVREVSPPSWRRSLKRGALWGGVMFIVVVFVLRTGPPAERIVIGLAYAAMFVPLTYWIDRIAYRNYLRRSGKL